MAGLIAIYGVVIVALGSTVAPYADGWRMSRRVRLAVIVVAALGGLPRRCRWSASDPPIDR